MDKSGQDLWNELRDKQSRMESALGDMGKYGREMASRKRDYRVALKKQILVERANGTSISLAEVLSKGDDTVSQKEFEWDTATVNYDLAKETVNVYKMEAKQIDEQINREWNRS